MNRLYLVLVLFIFASCDFSSRLDKEILHAQNSINNQDYAGAAEQYEDIIKLNPPSGVKVKIYFQLGELYSLHLGKYKEALTNYQSIIDIAENPLWSVKAEEKIADLQFSVLGNYGDAVKSYMRLYSYVPTLEKQDYYEYRLGLSYMNNRQLGKSIEVFNKISANPTHKYNVQSYYELGLCYFEQKKWEEASKYWIQHLRRETKKDEVVKTKFLLANAYESMENLKDAYDLYYSILGEYPNTEVIKNRLKALYNRRVARRR